MPDFIIYFGPWELLLSLATLAGATALAVWVLRKQQRANESYIVNGLVIAATFTVLVAPDFPWYFAWLIPFLCFIPSIPVFYLTLSSFLLYLTWIYWETDTQVFKIKALMFVPFFFLLAVTIWRQRREIRLQTATE